jgi:hypothetical protein
MSNDTANVTKEIELILNAARLVQGQLGPLTDDYMRGYEAGIIKGLELALRAAKEAEGKTK